MSGHGHVAPRPDGVKARCGGPALCSACAREKAQQVDPKLSAAKAVLREREAELLELKGPCRTPGCRLHFAHRGPCDISARADE